MTTALAAPTTIVVADLLLVRMALPSATPKRICEDLGKLLDGGMSADALDELRNELTFAGFLTKGKRNAFALTDAGRERGLKFLGVAELPPRTNWSAVIAKYLFPKASGLSAEAAAKLKKADNLAALILKQKYGLAAVASATVNQVLEAIVCKELGFPEETTLDGLLRAVLCRLVGSDSRLTKADLAKQLPLFKTGLKRIRADDVRRKLVRSWLTDSAVTTAPDEPRPAEPFDLAAFALTVRAFASRSPAADRFHDNKVFIAALWRASQREANFPRLKLPEFKRRLVEANAQHSLHLSRADLVQAMDPQAVADSETVDGNATFHFVLLEGDRP
jgi:hypothetical protein